MKTKINYLYYMLLIVVISLTSSGCYTHLAYVDQNLDSDSSEPIIIYVPELIIWPSPPPVYDPIYIPPSGSVTPTTEAPTYPTRNSGYQRSGSTSENNATETRTDRRASGSIRTGR